ncbi:hypothetical protein ACFLST_01420 [Chloroflexota bacterium]
MNVVGLEVGGSYDHLPVPEVGWIVRELGPKAAILSYFGMIVWRAKPWWVVAKLLEETGVRVIAVGDGMRFDLAELD